MLGRSTVYFQCPFIFSLGHLYKAFFHKPLFMTERKHAEYCNVPTNDINKVIAQA